MSKTIEWYLEREKVLLKPDFTKPLSVCLAYPDFYENGVANLAISTLYRAINSRKDAYATRIYVPDPNTRTELKDNNIEYFSWEDKKPLKKHDILAFSISFEELYPNILDILELGNIPIFSKDRTSRFPLIIAGGPTVSYNPEPMADFIDAFVIGDGDEAIGEILDAYKKFQRRDREELLKSLAKLAGLYVPSLYNVSYDGPYVASRVSTHGAPRLVRKRVYTDVAKNPARSIFITDQSIYKESNYAIEFARGCVHMCNFCQYSYNSKKPRFLDVETAIELIRTEGIGNAPAIRIFYEALPPHKLEKLFSGLESLIDKHGVKLRIGAFTSNQLTEDVIRIAAKGGQTCITVAPETTEGRLRSKLGSGKSFSDEKIFEVARMAYKQGIADFGLYLMIGLPTERFDDVYKMGDLVMRVRKFMDSCRNDKGILEIHLNPFFPKPLTPFQWAGVEPIDVSLQKLKVLEEMISKEYKISIDNRGRPTVGTGYLGEEERSKGYKVVIKTFVGTKMQFSQPVLSRGDRRVGKILYWAYKDGNTLEAWQNAFRGSSVDPRFYLDKKGIDDVLPWGFIDNHVSKESLRKRWIKIQ